MSSSGLTRRRALQFACAMRASLGLPAASLLRFGAASRTAAGFSSTLGTTLSVSAHASEPHARPEPVWPAHARRFTFKTSDGLKLSFLDTGPSSGPQASQGRHEGVEPKPTPTLVFIPGWLMPAEVFLHQVAALAHDHRVVVLDPRSQGQSALHVSTQAERLAGDRARDIHELIAHLRLNDLVLIGWSLGVLECLDCIRLHGVSGLRALVLIDNSVGEGPAPQARASRRPKTATEFDAYIDGFVKAMIRHPEDAPIARAVRQSALRLRRTPARAFEILGKPWPREIYRDAVYAVRQPVWYAITPRYREQGERLTEYHSAIRVTLYEDATHAIFVDQPARFNADLRAFLESVS